MTIQKSKTTVGMYNAGCWINGQYMCGVGFTPLEALNQAFAIINWNLYGIK